MKKIKEMIVDKKFYICIIIALAFFGVFTKLEYATDTYTVFENSAASTIEHFLASGRFVTAGCQFLVRTLDISNELTYIISFVLSILCLSIALYRLYRILKEDIKSIPIAMFISVLIVINAFSIELFMYIEKGIMLLSVLLNILAVEKLIEYFKENKKSLVLVFVYMLIANFSYQGTVALFVALSLVYILKYSKNIKIFIKNNIVTALGYGIPALINYLIVKFIFANNRIAGEVNIAESIKKVISGTKQMLLTYSIIPKYLFVTLIGVLLLVIIYHIIKHTKTPKEKLMGIFGVIYVILGTLVVTILPQLMQATESIWFVPRSSYAFGAILGILILYLYMNYKVNDRLEKVLLIGIVAYLLVQFVNFGTIARDHYIVNYMEKYEANQIEEVMQEYENSTGKTVTKIAFYQSKTPSWSYPGIKSIGDMNIKAIYPDWARIPYLKHYINRTFDIVEKSDEIYQLNFANKDWNYFSKEQIVIKEDTLHIYIY